MVIKKNTNIKSTKCWAGLLFAQFIFFYLFSKSDTIVHLFKQTFNTKKHLHQELFNDLPISIGDLFYIILVFFLLFTTIKALKTKNFRNLFIIANLLYFLYQLFWGMLYFQKPIYEKSKMPEISTQELEKLTMKYIALTNHSRKKLNQQNLFRVKNINVTKANILKSQKLIPKKFYKENLTNINNFKPSIFGKILNYTGILGYYNPFTSEAQYNSNLPHTYIPFTLAHESAHQLGFAREQEANFIGFLICKNSTNLELNYSAYLYTSKSLLNNLKAINPEFAGQAKLFYSDEVKKDIESEKSFFERHNTFINPLFHFTNDLFLKSNRQEGSITYNYFINLLIAYELGKI